MAWHRVPDPGWPLPDHHWPGLRWLRTGCGRRHRRCPGQTFEVGGGRGRVGVVVAIHRGLGQDRIGSGDDVADQGSQAGGVIDLFRVSGGGHGAQDGRQQGRIDHGAGQIGQAGGAVALEQAEPYLFRRLVARDLCILQPGLGRRQAGLAGRLVGCAGAVIGFLGGDDGGLGLIERLLAAGQQDHLLDHAGAVGHEALGAVGEVAGRVDLAHLQARLAVALQGLADQSELVAALPAHPVAGRERLLAAVGVDQLQRVAIGAAAGQQAQVHLGAVLQRQLRREQDAGLAGDAVGAADAIITAGLHAQWHLGRCGLVQGELELAAQFAGTALGNPRLGGGPHDARLEPDLAFGQGELARDVAHLAIAVGCRGLQIGGGEPVAVDRCIVGAGGGGHLEFQAFLRLEHTREQHAYRSVVGDPVAIAAQRGGVAVCAAIEAIVDQRDLVVGEVSQAGRGDDVDVHVGIALPDILVAAAGVAVGHGHACRDRLFARHLLE